MGKSHNKSKQSKNKELRNSGRKSNRGNFQQEIQQYGKFVEEQLEDEKTVRLSIAEISHTSEVHRCLSDGDFQMVRAILNDPNIDAEENKFRAATYYDERLGTSAAQEAIRRKAPHDVVELLAFIGGEQAVIAKDVNGYNAIHLACKMGSSCDVVDALCFVGKEAVNQQDNFGDLPIHKVAYKNGASTEVVKTLIDYGDRDMLEVKNKDGALPVHSSVYFFNTNLKVCKLLVTEGLHQGVGGEKGMGGLNVEYDDISGTRKTTFEKLKEKNLLNCLLGEIKDVVSSQYGTTLAEAGAKHGLQWQKGMEDLVEATDCDEIKLGIIALAASGMKNDLHTIYQLCLRYAGVLFG